jgi:Ca-activated chloride channel family protein
MNGDFFSVFNAFNMGQLEFSWPWLLLCLPLPWLVRRLLPASSNHHEQALHVPFIDDFSPLQKSRSGPYRNRWLMLLASIAWCCLVIAAARPQWTGERIDIPLSGRDLMLAVDLSASMSIEDFELNGQQVNRLQAVKQVAGDFIQQRQGDRIGLILFGEQAYLQTPLTFDTRTVNTMLQEALIGIAGKATAIGDSIGLAIKRLNNQSAQSRVLILLTDGENTAGEVSPLKAAELAARQNLKIYTIGVGAATREVGGLFFNRSIKNNEIDEKTLTKIAQLTGGRYFRAHDLQQLDQIYELIDKLEPIEQASQSFRPVKSLYVWPLSLALLISALIMLHKLLQPFALTLRARLADRFLSGRSK